MNASSQALRRNFEFEFRIRMRTRLRTLVQAALRRDGDWSQGRTGADGKSHNCAEPGGAGLRTDPRRNLRRHLPANTRLIQDELAEAYEVSRQPVQQAIMLLRDRGFVSDAPKRGVVVAELNVALMRSAYEVREVLDGLSCRLAAERAGEQAEARGRAIIARGREAIASGSIARQIAEDIAFHQFITELSGNAVIEEARAPALAPHAPHHGRGASRRAQYLHRHLGRARPNPRGDRREGRGAGRPPRPRPYQPASAKFISKLETMHQTAETERRSRSVSRSLR